MTAGSALLPAAPRSLSHPLSSESRARAHWRPSTDGSDHGDTKEEDRVADLAISSRGAREDGGEHPRGAAWRQGGMGGQRREARGQSTRAKGADDPGSEAVRSFPYLFSYLSFISTGRRRGAFVFHHLVRYAYCAFRQTPAGAAGEIFAGNGNKLI